MAPGTPLPLLDVPALRKVSVRGLLSFLLLVFPLLDGERHAPAVTGRLPATTSSCLLTVFEPEGITQECFDASLVRAVEASVAPSPLDPLDMAAGVAPFPLRQVS